MMNRTQVTDLQAQGQYTIHLLDLSIDKNAKKINGYAKTKMCTLHNIFVNLSLISMTFFIVVLK